PDRRPGEHAMTADPLSGPASGTGPTGPHQRARSSTVVPDTIGGNALSRQYRNEHVPTRAPHQTAALLLARAGDRLEHRAAADYILSAGKAIRRRRVPTDAQLSEKAVRLALDAPLSWVTEDWYAVERPWESLPPDELLALLSVGFGEDARLWELRQARDAGELDPAALDWDDYLHVFRVDRQPEAIFTVFLGCLPGAAAGIVAGVTVGVLTGSPGLGLGIVLGSALLGHGLTFIRASALDAEDREHHLGERYDRAFSRIYLGTGPVVAVILSMLVVLGHALL
ncbi:MAG: hypothetical protein PVH07_07090, partial [Chloroflexota bacterium]